MKAIFCKNYKILIGIFFLGIKVNITHCKYLNRYHLRFFLIVEMPLTVRCQTVILGYCQRQNRVQSKCSYCDSAEIEIRQIIIIIRYCYSFFKSSKAFNVLFVVMKMYILFYATKNTVNVILARFFFIVIRHAGTPISTLWLGYSL